MTPLVPTLGGPLDLPRQPSIPTPPKAITLVGGAGSDRLAGGRSNDVLDGGAGDDILTPGSGIDRLWGGAGNDTFVFRDGDLVDFLPYAVRIFDFAAGDRIRLEGFANFGVEAYNGSDVLLYAGGPDGSGGRIVITNATVEAVRAAIDLITRGTAILVSGTEGANLLTGTAGADDLRGLGGDDEIRGGEGADDIEGGAGSDIINGGQGRDVLRGGSRMNGGDSDGDIFVHQVGDGDDTIMDFSAGFGDKILLLGVDSFQTAMNDSSLKIYTYVGGVLQDIITVRNIYNADNFDQYIFVAPIVAPPPPPPPPPPPVTYDRTLNGTAANNVLNGDSRNEQINGLGGHDVLNGAGGSDRLDGGLGNDTLNGGAGDDILIGGLGGDVFVAGAGGGADVVNDFTLGQDLIDASTAAALVSMTQQGADTLVTFADGATLLVLNVQATALSGAIILPLVTEEPSAEEWSGSSLPPDPSASPPPPPEAGPGALHWQMKPEPGAPGHHGWMLA